MRLRRALAATGAAVVFLAASAAHGARLRSPDSGLTRLNTLPPMDYTTDGPFSLKTRQQSLALPAESGIPDCTLRTTLTVPVLDSHSTDKLPLVVMFNGFQLSSTYYAPYAQRLASWGYAVLQYDLPRSFLISRIVPDDVEVGILPLLLDWAKEQYTELASSSSSSSSTTTSSSKRGCMAGAPACLAAKTSSTGHGGNKEGEGESLSHHQQQQRTAMNQLDTSSIAVVGHSRGAKLAALALAQGGGEERARKAGQAPGVRVAAAVLIDPVDMTDETQRAGYPSAVEELTGANRTAALIGAGVMGRCNPVLEGHLKFRPVLAAGSWLQVVVPAGHMQFAGVSGPMSWAFDKLCGAGAISHQDAIELTASTAVAWIDKHFRPAESEERVGRFLDWAAGMAQRGTITWEVKGSSGSSSPGPVAAGVAAPAGGGAKTEALVGAAAR